MMSAKTQTLDRVSINSGGGATSRLYYAIGETFNFKSVADNGFSLETGTAGSTGNTGIFYPAAALNEFTSKASVKCYPNPATNLLTVDLSGAEDVSGIALFNEIGLVVKQAKPNGNKAYVNVQHLPSGVYYAVSMNGKKIVGANKIVKQ